MQFLEAPGLLSGLFIFISSIGVAVAGGYMIRLRVHYSILQKDHEVAG